MAQKVIELAAPDGGLGSCLAQSKVPKDVRKFLTEARPSGLGLESLQDFVSLIKHGDFEADIDRRIVQPLLVAKRVKPEDEPIVTSRTRAAYLAGHRALGMLEQSQAPNPVVASVDEVALPDTVKTTLDNQWAAAYPGWERDSFLQMVGSQVFRIYREWNGVAGLQHSVYDLSKLKTQLSERFPTNRRSKVQLGPLSLSVDQEEEGLAFQNVLQVYMAIRVLGQCWAYVGTGMQASKISPGTNVRQMPLHVALAYADMALRRSAEVEPSQVVAWMLRNDRITRNRMTSWLIQGFPPQEALQKAIHETHEWTTVVGTDGRQQSTSSSATLEQSMWGAPELPAWAQPPVHQIGTSAKRPPPVPPGAANPADGTSEPVTKKLRTVSTLKGNRPLCKSYNDGRGCPGAAGKQCSAHRKWHLCDAVLPDGTPCGQPHPRSSNH